MKRKPPDTAVALRPQDVKGYDELTYREQQFCLHPETLTNPMAAALAVGYSPSYSRANAHSLRKRLLRYIAPQRIAIMAQAQISLEEVARRLAAIARADPADYMERIEVETTEGFETVVAYKDPATWTEEQRMAVQRIVYETIISSNGTVYQADRPSDVIFYPKDKALKELREMFPKLDPVDPAKDQAELFEYMEADDLDLISRIYTRAEKRRTNKLKPVIEGQHAEPRPQKPDRRTSTGEDQGQRERSRPAPQHPPADARVAPRKPRDAEDRPPIRDDQRSGGRVGNPPVHALPPPKFSDTGHADEEDGDGNYREF